MATNSELLIDRLYTVNTDDEIPQSRKNLGRLIFWAASALVILSFLAEGLFKAGKIPFGFSNWQPVLYAIVLWCSRSACRWS